MPWKKNWLPFSEAREIVASQGFTSFQQFARWKDRPDNIPANPRLTYPSEWAGNEYWLGKGPAKERSRPSERVPFLPFPQARDLAQELMRKYLITSQTSWHVFAKTLDRPKKLPADPSKAYRGKGWVSWPDWFGRKPSRASGRERVRPFVEAREFARTLGVTSSRDWYTWASTSDRPVDIPYSPDARYRDEGWIGWGDFLGCHSRWSHREIIGFLDSLAPCIEQLSELDLYLILSRNGMLQRDTRLRCAKLLRSLKHLRSADDIERAKSQVAAELAKEDLDVAAGNVDEAAGEVALEQLDHDDGSSLRSLDILATLKAVDRVAELRVTNDPDVLEFMVEERVGMLWQEAMASSETAVVNELAKLATGDYAAAIRRRFTAELGRVNSIPLPAGYRMVNASGQPVEINLMQRLTAYRLQHEGRIGNWSGVGTGKTNAAVYAAAVMESRMTLILAANSTVSGWKKTIQRAFSTDALHIHDGRPLGFRFECGKKNFLVVNYETFQQSWSAEFIKVVTDQAPIDFIVFDEVQFARQRHTDTKRISARRLQVNALIRLAIGGNPDLRILAMSATPVVNNLREAVKLLELVLPGQDFSHVPVGASLANAVGVHFLMRRHGIRFKLHYDQQLERRAVAIDGQRWLDQIARIRPRDVLQMEQTLLEAKLLHLGKWVRRGTLIYTHYVDDIVEPLTHAVERLGLRVSHFTGKERVGIERFVDDYKNNKTDVLIGSAPVGTGVDGLQEVLDRVVFITLPWSSAEYEQIIGRLWRQGSEFAKVDVFVPQVTLREERAGQWSWDDLRLRCIEYKQTLADAALDGTIPKGGLPTREEMQARSLQSLKVWIEKVSQGLPEATNGLSSSTPPSEEPSPTPVA